MPFMISSRRHRYFFGGAQGTYLLRQCHHGGQQRCGGPLLRGHRQDLQGAGRGELPNRQQLRRSGGTDRKAPALPCAGGAGYDLASGLKENRKKGRREPALFFCAAVRGGTGAFYAAARLHLIRPPVGAPVSPAGRSVRGSDRPPACHSTPRTPGGRLRGRALKGKAGGKFGGCCPFAGNFFAFRGWGQTILIRGYGYEVQKERDGRAVRTVRPVRRRATAGRAILPDQR